MTDQIKRAIQRVEQALLIVRRSKHSTRAEFFLRQARDGLRHPGPRMLRDVPMGRDHDPADIDFGNVYVTAAELCELADLSPTTVRTLVNDGFLPQEHRGLYRVHDVLEAWQFYQSRPR